MTSTSAVAQVRSSISDAVRDFQDLPDTAHVRVRTVATLIGCSVPTIWRMAADGRLPRPRKFSARLSAWNCGELRAALATVPA